MKKILLLILIVSFCNALSYSQDFEGVPVTEISKVIVIDLNALFTPTGIQLDVGDTVLIFSNGLMSPWIGYDWVSPDGWGEESEVEYPVPDASALSVVGKIGIEGVPFYIGSLRAFSSTVSGELFLGINDDFLSDNIGCFVAWVICNSCSGLTTDISIAEPQTINIDLNQNYPNPFSPETTIEFSTKKDGITKLEIYNVSGEKVSTLLNEFKPAGNYKIKWNGKDDFGNSVVTGTYFYTLEFNNKIISKKMILVK